MTTAHRAIRRRLTLLASSSAGAIAIMAAVGGGITLAPSRALAFDECGTQSGSTPIICAPGTYPTIRYVGSGGDLNLVLQDAVNVTTSGVYLGNGFGDAALKSQTTTEGAGDFHILSSAGQGVVVTAAGNTLLDFTDAGGGSTITGSGAGVLGLATGDVTLNLGRTTISSTGWYSAAVIGQTTGSGNVTINAGGALSTDLFGDGIHAYASEGAIDITTSADADITTAGSGGTGIQAYGAGPITVVADGDIGSATGYFSTGVDATNVFNPGVGGDIDVTVNGDVYTDGFVGLGATNYASTGAVNLNFGATRAAHLTGQYFGIYARNLNAANLDNVNVTIGDGSSITAALGAAVGNSGLGESAIQIGNGVTFDQAVYGAAVVSQGRASAVAGDDLTINLNSNSFGSTAFALLANSNATADTNGQSAVIDVGQNATLISDNPFSQNVGLISAVAQNGTASTSITVGDGLTLREAGEYVAGVYSATNLGDIDISVGTGSIDLTGGFPFVWYSVLPGNDGILGISQGGNVSVTSGADISTVSNQGFASAIQASTGGAGNVTVSSTGALTSSTYGILANAADGVIDVTSTGDINAGFGVVASAGTGSVNIATGGDIHAGWYAVEGIANTGAVTIHTAGNLWADTAIYAESQGPITIVSDANLGSADQAIYRGVSAIGGWYWGGLSSDVNVTVNGDVYTSNFYYPSVEAQVLGDTGSATVNFGMTRAATLYGGSLGLRAEVTYYLGTGDAAINIGNGSTLISSGGAVAANNGLGNASTIIGSDVTFNAASAAAQAYSTNGRAFVSAGDNLSIMLHSEAGWGFKEGLSAFSHAYSDAGAPTVEVDVGDNATITSDDPTSQDNHAIMAQVLNGTSSARVAVGDGLTIAIAGEYSGGVYAQTGGGGIEVSLGTGLITLSGGEEPWEPYFSRSAGVEALSNSGDIIINSNVSIDAASNFAPVFGIYASTDGAGGITISSGGLITSTGLGISAMATDGDVVLTNSGSVTGVPSAILAATTGTGGVSVVNSGSATGTLTGITAAGLGSGAVSVVSTGSLMGDVGVRAVSQDGAVNVTATGSVMAATTGIDAQALGAGDLTIQAGGVQAGHVGVMATTSSSDVRVTASGDVVAATGPGILIASGGDAHVDVGSGAVVSGLKAIRITSAGDATVNNDGTIRTNGGALDDVVLTTDSATATLHNGGLVLGAVDFSGAGSVAFTNTGTWRTAGMSTFTAGADSLDNSGLISIHGTTIDFGDGADVFTNSGTLAVGDSMGASTLTLANLETFNNSGLIVFGRVGGQNDGEPNDRLVAHGTAFTGSGDSTLAMDVDLGSATQADCSAASVADCFDLTGGSTAGSTLIRVNDTGQSAGALNTGGIVLVDVHGGTSHAEDFTLDPASDGYVTDGVLGAGLEKGLFLYKLDYDAANERHRLISLPGRHVFEFAPLTASAQSVWYTSTGSWFDRQADVRDAAANGDIGPGVWIRMTGANVNRDTTAAYGQYLFDASTKQNTVGVQGGVDLMHGAGEGQAYVVGLTAGNLNSDVEFKASHAVARFEGQSYGAYASWVGRSFFLDGIVQTNHLDMRDGAVVGARGKVKSTGGQIEGGWRMPFASISVEPLASLAYVRTQFDDLALTGASLQTDDAKSLRGSLGVRVSGETSLGASSLRWQTTARAWDEFEGKNRAELVSNGQSVGLPDDVSGAFGDVGVGISLYSPSGHVSTFLNTGLQFGDNYRGSDTTVGFRVQW